MSALTLATLLTLAPSVGPASATVVPDHSLELGVAAGVFMASKDHGLQSDGVAASLGGAGLDLSLRIAYLPFSFIGMELEGGHISLSNEDGRGEMYAARGHLVVLYPAAFTPFVVGGAGVIGLVGGDDFMGADHQPAVHYGAGIKTLAMNGVTLRADARHVMALTDDGMANHFEMTFGAAFTISGSN